MLIVVAELFDRWGWLRGLFLGGLHSNAPGISVLGFHLVVGGTVLRLRSFLVVSLSVRKLPRDAFVALSNSIVRLHGFLTSHMHLTHGWKPFYARWKPSHGMRDAGDYFIRILS